MGLFDKKFCDICGEKIGLLGNRKLEDGNMCKNCAKKLSPWFDERRHSTIEEIKKQLEYREKTKTRSEPSMLQGNAAMIITRYILTIHSRNSLFLQAGTSAQETLM